MTNAILAKIAVLISADTAAFGKNLKQAQGDLNKFTGAVSSAAKLLSTAFTSVAVYQGLREGVGILAEFESTMSEVQAITGATGREFDSLETDARRLGASTKYTASQVGQLQVAYGRLGFTTKEIINATEATLDLAAATGEDLAKSADVAGSTVRGFGLNAVETQRVVDVMAASFNKTALGLDNFTESMKYVAPVANAAGATVEETTALLGTLADAGIRGSMAGTSLRKIFTDMTKDGRPLRERLAELAKKGITLADSFDEVGRTAQTSLLILANNTEKTDALTRSFQNVTGEAAKMARIMRDNLTGDVDKLSSAWEGLILAMSDTGFLRKVTKDLTGFLNLLSGNTDIEDELDVFARAFSEGATNTKGTIEDFIKMISETRRELGKPIDTNIVNELAEKYKLTSEQANQFYAAVLQINEALSFQEKAMKQFKEFATRNGYTDLSKAADDYKQRLYELILQEQVQREGLRKSAAVSADHAKAFDPSIKAADEQIAAYRRIINILTEYQSTLTSVNDTISQTAEVDHTVTLEKLRGEVKKLGEQYSQTNVKDLRQLEIIQKKTAAIDMQIQALENLGKAGQKPQLQFLPDLEAEGSTNPDLRNDQAANDANEFAAALDQVAVSAEFAGGALIKLENNTEKSTEKMKEAMLDLGPAVSNGLSSLARGLGEAAAGVGNFGDSIIKAMAGFVVQIGEALIAIGTGMVLAKLAIKNPYTAIAGGIALVALGTAMGAAMSKAQSDFSSSGSSGGIRGNGSSAGSSDWTTNSSMQDSAPELITILKGQDIWVALSNYQKGNIHTRPVG